VRVAFFTDSFHEVNGVANTSRQFDAFARRRSLPFLNVHAGPAPGLHIEDTVRTLELDRGPAAFKVERDMSFDPLLMRHRDWAVSVVRDFHPDIIHITGPSDVGILGAWLANHFEIPLVASWHTNLHEFGARRLDKLISFLPPEWRDPVTGAAERGILYGCGRFYSLASVLLAPNQELVDMLGQRTGRPAFLMQRGVDTLLYSPERRARAAAGPFVFGYVGRITPEKNVRLLARLERALIDAGERDFRITVVGHGDELDWLRENLVQAVFPGVLGGEDLARAYADFDLFLFPSHTDTFGNVILEAAASGVPSVVTPSGGPRFLVQNGVTGCVSVDDDDFIARAIELYRDRERCAAMRAGARAYALTMSWDVVFEKVYESYTLAVGEKRSAAGA
jgi:glycosyltransferase involved in cell wall biosynthesis